MSVKSSCTFLLTLFKTANVFLSKFGFMKIKGGDIDRPKAGPVVRRTGKLTLTGKDKG